jgi:hypothetical protein
MQTTHRVVVGSGGSGTESANWYSTTLVALGAALPFDRSLYPAPAERAIYVIVVTGDFEIRAARLPPGARPPRGPILLLAFDQQTLRRIPAPVLLFQAPNLPLLGEAHVLKYDAA